MSCPVLAKASHAWLFISIPGAVSGGGFPPWVATAECVISLSSDEHLPSYPEKLRLCHGAIMSCLVGCSRNCLTPVGESSLGLGAGPWWDMEVTDAYCATLGLRVVGYFSLTGIKSCNAVAGESQKLITVRTGRLGRALMGGVQSPTLFHLSLTHAVPEKLLP